MRKYIIAAIAVVLCISLTGCGAYFDALEDIGSAYQDEMDKILGGGTGNTDDKQTTDSNTAENGMQITMPHDRHYYTGNERPVGRIVAELEELGFTNITTIEVEKRLVLFRS